MDSQYQSVVNGEAKQDRATQLSRLDRMETILRSQAQAMVRVEAAVSRIEDALARIEAARRPRKPKTADPRFAYPHETHADSVEAAEILGVAQREVSDAAKWLGFQPDPKYSTPRSDGKWAKVVYRRSDLEAVKDRLPGQKS